MRPVAPAAEISERDLDGLGELWTAGLGAAYETYRVKAQDPRVAFAAALVETGLSLQGIGSHAAPPGELLLGDLCLARASRLLADVGDQGLQIAFARVVERVSSEAAAGAAVPAFRPLLVGAVRDGR